MTKYKHQCWEWDGLEIDEHMPEFSACDCYEETDEIRALKTKAREKVKTDYRELQGD